MPGLVKIGFTIKVPTERAAELSTTGVPTPFDVEFYCLVDEPAALENKIHETLAHKRESNDREFFRIQLSDAIKEVNTLSPKPEHVWYKNPQACPRPSRVECPKCGAYYIYAVHCPKCQIKLTW